MFIINRLCIYSIRLIRPLLGPACCKFAVSCTEYAVEQFSTAPFHKAVYFSARRVLSCNPFNKNTP